MQIHLATEAGTSGSNEDWCAATQHAIVVLDGVTGAPETGCHHDVVWYVHQLGSHLVAALATPDLGLAEVLAAAIDKTADLHRDCDLTHPGTPSATVAVLRVGVDAVEHLVLADATIVLDTLTGIQVVTDTRVETAATAEQEALSQHPVGSEEHRRGVAAVVAAQLQVRNRPGGYWVAAADPAAAEHALTGSVPHAHLRRAAVLTDGASRLVDRYELHTWAGLLDLLAVHGPIELIRRVRAADHADPAGNRWSRYKLSDDATAVFLDRASR